MRQLHHVRPHCRFEPHIPKVGVQVSRHINGWCHLHISTPCTLGDLPNHPQQYLITALTRPICHACPPARGSGGGRTIRCGRGRTRARTAR